MGTIDFQCECGCCVYDEYEKDDEMFAVCGDCRKVYNIFMIWM